MSDQREQKRPLTTTNFDSPAPSDEYSLTVGAGGPNPKAWVPKAAVQAISAAIDSLVKKTVNVYE